MRPFDHKINEKSRKNGSIKQGDRRLDHYDKPALVSNRANIAKSNGMEGNNTEINRFFEVNFICDGVRICCHTNAVGDIIEIGKQQNGQSIQAQEEENEQQDFFCFDGKVHDNKRFKLSFKST